MEQMKMEHSGLTGVKDADLEILKNLDDRSLLNVCLISNRYINSLCSNQDFWRNRFVQYFGQEASTYKPQDRTWKRHYLTVIMYLDELLQPDSDIAGNPFEFFRSFVQGRIGYGDFYQEVNQSIGTLHEQYQVGYWLLNLGNKISIDFQVDRYEEVISIVREYTSDTHFTPADIVKIISDFYEEPVTAEELLDHQGQDNPNADGLTVEDANNGLIQRKNLVNMFFEGLSPLANGNYYIDFGS